MLRVEGDTHDSRENADASDILSEHVENELDRILCSANFDASDRNRNFLRYVVTETLAGRASRIKGYNIALAVFDRDSTFDPQIDPVVRIEAGRLRRSLERYYLTDGRNNDFRISINKGSYVPSFQRPPRFRSQISPPRHPSLLVTLFADLSDDRHPSHFAEGLTEDIIAELNQHSQFRVFVEPSAPHGALSAMANPSPAGLHLSGSVRQSKGAVRVIAHLIDQAHFRCVWSEALDRRVSSEGWLAIQRDVSKKVARSIARWGLAVAPSDS